MVNIQWMRDQRKRRLKCLNIIDEAMCDMLKNAYRVFEAACQGQEKVSLSVTCTVVTSFSNCMNL